MTHPVAAGVVLAVLVGGPAAGVPLRSADVVRVTVTRNSLADGLESFRVKLTVRDGWHLVAPPEKAAGVIEFRLGGEKAWVHPDVARPGTVTRTDAAGRAYRAYRGSEFVGWLAWEDTQHAAVVAARVRVVATDGKTRLPASVVAGEMRLRE